jgi:hypothetical protein
LTIILTTQSSWLKGLWQSTWNNEHRRELNILVSNYCIQLSFNFYRLHPWSNDWHADRGCGRSEFLQVNGPISCLSLSLEEVSSLEDNTYNITFRGHYSKIIRLLPIRFGVFNLFMCRMELKLSFEKHFFSRK